MAVGKIPKPLDAELKESQSFQFAGMDSFSQGVGCHAIIIPHAPNSLVTVNYCHVKGRTEINWGTTNVGVNVVNKKYFSILQIDYNYLPTGFVDPSVIFDYNLSVSVSN